MAGFDLPVEPRKRYTYIFNAAEPLDRDLPLTIDPSGVHMRSEGDAYLPDVRRSTTRLSTTTTTPSTATSGKTGSGLRSRTAYLRSSG